MLQNLIKYFYSKKQFHITLYNRFDFKQELLEIIENPESILDMVLTFFSLFNNEENLIVILDKTKKKNLEIVFIVQKTNPEIILRDIYDFLLEGYTYSVRIRTVQF